ncbi:uncharacterized protein LOC143297525 [Babylonia areolata]|uniref:uncharacterized protein LOC143297525 n=1 Tax=Babylonia areolata TaxID=304850 RepID=UPI003FD0B60F
MEHRVKQRSEEWFKLRQTVMLTSSQFADAVGVGKGRPFHFFQSLVQRDDSQECEDDVNCGRKKMMQHGLQMETVIKEAYELLTGLRVAESGFWVPEEGHSMEGLIGASPDGVVVSEKDVTRMLGLVEFKAPIHKLYDQMPGTRHGIPRQYMVQIQGQMAVCGAPWCDFMAVCCNTKDIMLKRVYFQPRYWEHISSRLKQFCFALQEAEIMQELKRDAYSGAMTQRIKTLPMQDNKLFPAEDIITVENLLTPSPPHLYRGPSHKLLSYQVLVGDTYILPSTLSRYKQDLLAKVDAEIQLKVSHCGRDKVGIEEDDMGQVFHRVFSEDCSQPSPESPDTVFRDGSAVWGKENVDLSGDGLTLPAVSNSSGPSANEKLVKNGTDPLVSSNIPQERNTAGKNSTASQPSVKIQLGKKSANPQPGVNVQLVKNSAHPPPNSSKGQPVSGSSTALASVQSGQSSTSRTEAPRKLTRVTGSTRGVGRTRPVVGNMSSDPRPVVSGSQSAVSPRGSPRMPLRARGPRAAVSANMSTASLPRTGPRVHAPRKAAPAMSRGPGTSPRAGVPGTHMAVPRSSPSQSVQQVSAQPVAVSSAASVPSCRTASVCVGSISTSATMSMATTTVVCTASTTSTRTAPTVKKPLVSARDEWEMTAKRKQPLSGDLNNSASSAAVTLPTSTAQTESVTSQTQSKPVSSVAEDTSLTSGKGGEKDGGKAPSSQEDGMQWRGKVLSSGSSFIPPGLTLLSAGSPQAQQTALDMTIGSSVRSGVAASSEDQDKRDSGRQAHKRPATSSAADVEAKKSLMDKGPSVRSQGDDRERHRSPERLPIHRPWQSQEGREHLAASDRHMPFGRDRGEMAWDRPNDLGHHRLLPDDRGESRIPSVLDRGREDALSRVFDLQDRNRGQHGLLANPVSTAVQFDNLRHLPLDLSERHALQDRDVFSARGASMLGREGGLGLDGRGWRGQFSRQVPHQVRQQTMWQDIQTRYDLQALRNPLHGNWPRGQSLRMDGQHTLDLQQQLLRDRRFPDMGDGRDPRLGGANVDFRGDLIRGQFPRNFPRRPFDY